MAGPRRVLIDWDYCAHGIWWVLTREEKEAPPPRGGSWTGDTPSPPDSWPAGTWQQELLGYAPRDRHDASPGRG